MESSGTTTSGGSYLMARRLDGTAKRVISFAKLTGLSWQEIERGQAKGWFAITPKLVSNYLSDKSLC